MATARWTSRPRHAVLDQLREGLGDHSLLPFRSVVGPDPQLVARRGEPVAEDQKGTVARAEDRHDLVTRLLERSRDREDRRRSDSSGHARDRGAGACRHSGDLDAGRHSERPRDVVNRAAGVDHVEHLARGLSDRLHDHGDRASGQVDVGYGQRMRSEVASGRIITNLPRPVPSGDLRRGRSRRGHRRPELFACDDLEHRSSLPRPAGVSRRGTKGEFTPPGTTLRIPHARAGWCTPLRDDEMVVEFDAMISPRGARRG